MAATVTAPERAIIEARWEAAAWPPVRSAMDDGSWAMTPDAHPEWERFERTIQQWAAVCLGGEVFAREAESLDELVGEIHEAIHMAVVNWAERTLEARTQRHPLHGLADQLRAEQRPA